MKECYRIHDAAAILGVSVSTVIRLCEREKIELPRTPGGHRRIDPATMDKISRSHIDRLKSRGTQGRRFPIPSVETVLADLGSQDTQTLADRILRSAGDRYKVIDSVQASLVEAFWSIEIGDADGECPAHEVRRISQAAQRTIDAISDRISLSPFSTMVAVGGSLGTGEDTVASKLVALTFKIQGFLTFDLGARVPARDVADAARDLDARYIWSSHTHWSTDGEGFAEHEILRDEAPKGAEILIGGGGLSPSVIRSLSWCRYIPDLLQLQEWLGQQKENNGLEAAKRTVAAT